MGFKRLKLNDGSSAHISRGTDLNTKAVTAVSTFNANGSFAPASNNKKYQVFAVGGGAVCSCPLLAHDRCPLKDEAPPRSLPQINGPDWIKRGTP